MSSPKGSFSFLVFFVLFLSTLPAFVAGCGGAEEREVFKLQPLDRVQVDLGVIGDPQLFVASARRDEDECTGNSFSGASCTTVAREWRTPEIEDASCPDGGCEVRRLGAEEIAATEISKQLAASFRLFVSRRANSDGDQIPPLDRIAVFSVTPLTPRATFAVRARHGGSASTDSWPIHAFTVDRIAMEELTARFRDVIGSGPLVLVPGGTIATGCPRVHFRDDAPAGAGSSTIGLDGQADLEISTIGAALKMERSGPDCGSLAFQAREVGQTEIIAKRRAITASLAMRVASPDDVRTLAVHEVSPNHDHVTNVVSTEVAGTKIGETIVLACVLRLASGTIAFGGCGTLEANEASGLVPTTSNLAPGSVFAGFKRVAAPKTGGEIRGRFGLADVVIPVR